MKTLYFITGFLVLIFGLYLFGFGIFNKYIWQWLLGLLMTTLGFCLMALNDEKTSQSKDAENTVKENHATKQDELNINYSQSNGG